MKVKLTQVGARNDAQHLVFQQEIDDLGAFLCEGDLEKGPLEHALLLVVEPIGHLHFHVCVHDEAKVVALVLLKDVAHGDAVVIG